MSESSTIHALLSSTPTSQTWRTAHQLITDGEDITWRDNNQQTLLHLITSSAHSQTSYVDYLLPVVYQLADAGCDVNAVDTDGNTPLHACVVNAAGHRMAGALARIGVIADCRNKTGQTAIDIAVETGQRLVVTALKAAASGLWNALMSGDEQTVRSLIELMWFRVDLHRGGLSLTSAISKNPIPDNLMRVMTERSQYVRLMHSALAGNVDAVLHQLKYMDCRVVERQLRDRHYVLDDGTVTEWPLLAVVIQLRLTDVARVLIEQANFDVNAMILTDAGRRVPLFQWVVPLVVQQDVSVFRLTVDRSDLSLIVDPAEFVYDLWRRRLPAMAFDQFAGRDLSLVSTRDCQGRTLRDRVLLDSFDYGASDVMTTSLLYIDEFMIHLVTTSKLSCLERLMMEGYEHINVVDRHGRSAVQVAADAKLSSVVDFLNALPLFQVS